ncbi:MAG: adenosylcobinamide amidohydrolase [Desulfobacteraceae bacterium]
MKPGELVRRVFFPGVVFLAALAPPASAGAEYPFSFEDAMGRTVQLEERPARVVSLSPSATEVVIGLGAEDVLQAVTYHDETRPGVKRLKVVGGFFRPSAEAVQECDPDLVVCSSLQYKHLSHLSRSGVRLVFMETESLSQSYENIRLLGRIVDREDEAEAMVKKIQNQIGLIREKVSRIPPDQRKRVMRLMGGEQVTAPGDDSFQNEMIRAAGGLQPRLGRNGAVVPVDLASWKAFNPQVVYTCGGEGRAAVQRLDRPGWKDVEAVQKGRIYDFPCELTCRAAAHTGDFVAWLASQIYPEFFSRDENLVHEERVLDAEEIRLPLPYVKRARILRSRIHDFINKTLVLDFTSPMRIFSTLEGERSGVISAGNHFSPPPTWALGHTLGLEAMRERIYGVIGREKESASFLFTGADMDNLSIQVESFREMTAAALVTAGVRSNAVRMSRDQGRYYEPGTINILVLTNMRLTPRAMSRAVISAAEAKTAALQDLDIRSRENPLLYQATGTGTDNLLVVEGGGERIDNAGGHSKMGELLAHAIYKGVREAVRLQNGITADRSIISRLAERGISPYELAASCPWEHKDPLQRLKRLEQALLDPRYAGLMAAALALSDQAETGLVRDLTFFRSQCLSVARDLAGRPVEPLQDLVAGDFPEPLAMALNALLNGIAEEEK